MFTQFQPENQPVIHSFCTARVQKGNAQIRHSPKEIASKSPPLVCGSDERARAAANFSTAKFRSLARIAQNTPGTLKTRCNTVSCNGAAVSEASAFRRQPLKSRPTPPSAVVTSPFNVSRSGTAINLTMPQWVLAFS